MILKNTLKKLIAKLSPAFMFLRKIFLYKILRLQTAGVRIVLIRQHSVGGGSLTESRQSLKEEILLIKHPYDDFWVFPGGGIGKKEDPIIAARREVLEETDILSDDLNLFSNYKNLTGGKNDVVYLFISKKCSKYNQKNRSIIDSLEIAKIKWFALDNLPENLSAPTARRIKEIFYSQPISAEW